MEKIQEILNNGLDRYEKEHKIVKQRILEHTSIYVMNVDMKKLHIIHVGIGIVRIAKQERN